MSPRRSSGVFDHRDWLQLVDMDGPFLSVPELKRVYRQGFSNSMTSTEQTAFKVAKAAFEKGWDAWQANPEQLDAVRVARDEWVSHVLGSVFGWGQHLVADDSVRVQSPDLRVELTSTHAFRRGDTRAALVLVVDPVDSLRAPGTDGWAADQIDRMELLLRAAKVPVGVVTDGRWWAMVSAPPGRTVASGTTDSQTWVEDAQVRDAFAELLSPKRLAGGAAEDRLAQMFVNSVASAEEITEALGSQVRRAVELLVQAFSESATEAKAQGEPSPLPDDGDEIYAAAVATMMRMVFLLFAEERNLLPQGELFSQAYGLTGQREELHRQAQDNDGSLDSTWQVWHRLQATAKALSEGASFEDMRLPAYGGSLFAQDRFGFLTAVTARGTLALRVNDRVMMHVLDALQMTEIRGQGKRPISFRDIDVEQIGYIYEGLLGYTCHFATETVVGLIGRSGSEPEVPLDVLNDLAEQHTTDKALATAILAWVKEHQPSAAPSTVGQLTKALAASDSPTAEDDLALRAVTTDESLQDELRTWLGAIRRDLRDRPTVFLPGGLVVVETPSRKNAGAHYTPRALAEEVVLHALEPLVYQPGPHQTADRSQWQLKSPEEILGLKVADIACGSGAFLVAAARYLADKLVEAWAEGGRGIGTPEQQKLDALRLVVAKCLYGVDINEMAIEMCKLSLWLVSLDPKKPFSFVDDKLLVGNSLLGITDRAQLRTLHIDPDNAPAKHLFDQTASGYESVMDIEASLRKAIRIRRDLDSPIDNDNPMRSRAAKEDQLNRLNREVAKLHDVADGVVATGLRLGGKPGKALDNAYAALRMAVNDAYDPEGASDRTALDQILADGLTPTTTTDYERWQCLHWPIAFADVFTDGGFDAVVGNPPFLMASKIAPAMGANLRQWTTHQIAEGRTGKADLCSYFLLRAVQITKHSATIGLLTTNSIAQGDNHHVSTEPLIQSGNEIYSAIRSQPWPGSASLEYAALWISRSPIARDSLRLLDHQPVRAINSGLEELSRTSGAPIVPKSPNVQAFLGRKLGARRFIVTHEQATSWTAQSPLLHKVVRPYISGIDVNDRPSMTEGDYARFVIDFTGMSQREAQEYSEPFNELLRRTTPESILSQSNTWWMFESQAKSLQAAVQDLDEVLTFAETSSTVIPRRIPRDFFLNHKVVVVATEDYSIQAVLSSGIHWLWVVRHCTTQRVDPTYSPKIAVRAFPFPDKTSTLNSLGRYLNSTQVELMKSRRHGLTKLYNLVNDKQVSNDTHPDIAQLRQIHVELDQAVMAAYGWDDVPLDHGFHTYRQMPRWTVSPAARVEILDRLLEENHRRAAAQGDAPATTPDDEDEA